MDKVQTPDTLTAQQEIEHILRGEHAIVGLAPPDGAYWIPGFLARLTVECGGLPLGTAPDLLAVAGRFAIRRIGLPGRCGASTGTALYLPFRGTLPERRLTCAHELTHGVAYRLGVHMNEADWWLATAVLVLHAVREAPGAKLYPEWFVRAAESADILRG